MTGLPESFAEFASRVECPACGDVIHEDHLEGNVCIGCARRDDPTTSAERVAVADGGVSDA